MTRARRRRRSSPVAGLAAVSRQMPLKVKLPLLMSLVLAGVLAVALLAAYGAMRRTQISVVSERVGRAIRQLATIAGQTRATQTARFLPVANDSAVRAALRSTRGKPARPTPAVRAALQKLVLPTDSGLPVELWTADGRRVAFIGNDLRGTFQIEEGRPELPNDVAPLAQAEDVKYRDSLRIGDLYAENGRTYLWFVMPIQDRGTTIGYIAQQRRIGVGQNADRTLRELSGDSVSLYYHNSARTFWASVTGVPIAGLTNIDSVAGTARDSSGDEVLYHEQKLGSTPLVAGLAVPTRTVLVRPRRTIEPVLWLALVLVSVGIVIAWIIGRRMAMPIEDITTAAESLATGDYAARVPERGDVEVRRLAETFNRMAEEIAESRRALEQQTQQAHAASNAKSDFLAMMSHELRTPLNAIGGYVELLEMGLRGPITDPQRRDLDRIKQSQQHLLGLISGVLDLARVEAGKITYDLAPIAVDGFLAGLDALVGPQAAAKEITLKHQSSGESIAVVADREKLRQILLNLLSNAIRHTPAGGRVTLSARPSEQNVAIVVDDTGPGIPADKTEAIFEPFVQLDRTLTANREGVGLGLSISRDLARGMGGDLRVESNNGSGARFLLTLPRSSAEPEPEPITGERRNYKP